MAFPEIVISLFVFVTVVALICCFFMKVYQKEEKIEIREFVDHLKRRRAWNSDFEHIQMNQAPWIYDTDERFGDFDSLIWYKNGDKWYSEDTDVEYSEELEFQKFEEPHEVDMHSEVPEKLEDVAGIEIVQESK